MPRSPSEEGPLFFPRSFLGVLGWAAPACARPEGWPGHLGQVLGSARQRLGVGWSRGAARPGRTRLLAGLFNPARGAAPPSGQCVTGGARQGSPAGRPARAPVLGVAPAAPPRARRLLIGRGARYANAPDPARTCPRAPGTRSGTRPRGHHAALLPGEDALRPQGPQLRAAGDTER